MTILAFIFVVVITLIALGVVTHFKDIQPKNKVHFYVARDKNKKLWLYLGKPIKSEREGIFVSVNGSDVTHCSYFKNLGLNPNNYKDLKWEDEPVEVFLNLED